MTLRLFENRNMRRRLTIAGALVALSFLAVGASEVTRELRARPLRNQKINHCWQEWACVLVNDVPGGYGREWQQLARTEPELVLRACAVEGGRPLVATGR